MTAIEKYAARLGEVAAAGFTGRAIEVAVEVEVLATEAQNDVANSGPVVELTFPPVHVPAAAGEDDGSMESGRPWRAADQAAFIAAHQANLSALQAAG